MYEEGEHFFISSNQHENCEQALRKIKWKVPGLLIIAYRSLL